MQIFLSFLDSLAALLDGGVGLLPTLLAGRVGLIFVDDHRSPDIVNMITILNYSVLSLQVGSERCKTRPTPLYSKKIQIKRPFLKSLSLAEGSSL